MENSLSVSFDPAQTSESSNSTVMMHPTIIEMEPTQQKCAEITLNITLNRRSDSKSGGEGENGPVTYWTDIVPSEEPRPNDSSTTFTKPGQKAQVSTPAPNQSQNITTHIMSPISNDKEVEKITKETYKTEDNKPQEILSNDFKADESHINETTVSENANINVSVIPSDQVHQIQANKDSADDSVCKISNTPDVEKSSVTVSSQNDNIVASLIGIAKNDIIPNSADEKRIAEIKDKSSDPNNIKADTLLLVSSSDGNIFEDNDNKNKMNSTIYAEANNNLDDSMHHKNNNNDGFSTSTLSGMSHDCKDSALSDKAVEGNIFVSVITFSEPRNGSDSASRGSEPDAISLHNDTIQTEVIPINTTNVEKEDQNVTQNNNIIASLTNIANSEFGKPPVQKQTEIDQKQPESNFSNSSSLNRTSQISNEASCPTPQNLPADTLLIVSSMDNDIVFGNSNASTRLDNNDIAKLNEGNNSEVISTGIPRELNSNKNSITSTAIDDNKEAGRIVDTFNNDNIPISSTNLAASAEKSSQQETKDPHISVVQNLANGDILSFSKDVNNDIVTSPNDDDTKTGATEQTNSIVSAEKANDPMSKEINSPNVAEQRDFKSVTSPFSTTTEQLNMERVPESQEAIPLLPPSTKNDSVISVTTESGLANAIEIQKPNEEDSKNKTISGEENEEPRVNERNLNMELISEIKVETKEADEDTVVKTNIFDMGHATNKAPPQDAKTIDNEAVPNQTEESSLMPDVPPANVMISHPLPSDDSVPSNLQETIKENTSQAVSNRNQQLHESVAFLEISSVDTTNKTPEGSIKMDQIVWVEQPPTADEIHKSKIPQNTSTINTATNEIPSIVLPPESSDADRVIMYPDSKDWAMSEYTESSRADDEYYDIDDDADDDGSTVASCTSDVHGAGHRQALSRGLRLPAAAVVDGTIDPTAATLVAAVRAVTRVADERGEENQETLQTDAPGIADTTNKSAVDRGENNVGSEPNKLTPRTDESGPKDLINSNKSHVGWEAGKITQPIDTVGIVNIENKITANQDAESKNNASNEVNAETLAPTVEQRVSQTTPIGDQNVTVFSEEIKASSNVETGASKSTELQKSTESDIKWIEIPQESSSANEQSKEQEKPKELILQAPAPPAFSNQTENTENNAKEQTGIEKFEKIAEGWSVSGIATKTKVDDFSDATAEQQNDDSSKNKTHGNDKLTTWVEVPPDSSQNHNGQTDKDKIVVAKPEEKQVDIINTRKEDTETRVRFAPDVRDNAKSSEYEDYDHAINEYEQNLKKHTRETLDLVDKLCDESQRLAQQQDRPEFEKSAQNPFNALPRADTADTSNKINWNGEMFTTNELDLDIDTLRINPSFMVAPVNCTLLPEKRLAIIDDELGILLLDLSTRNILRSSEAIQSTTTKWRYPKCIAYVPEKDHLLVLAECCSIEQRKDDKEPQKEIPTLAEILKPRPTDFMLYICRFDAKTLRFIDRVEAPKFIRDKNVTNCHMCFAPPTGSIYLAVNTPYDAFLYELTEECRWIEVYNRRGRTFADLQYFAVVGPVTELLVLEMNKQHVLMISLYGSTVVGQRMVAVTERPAALAVDERGAVFAFDRASACVAQHSSMHFEKLRDIALVDRAQCKLSAREHLLAVLVRDFKQIKLYKY